MPGVPTLKSLTLNDVEEILTAEKAEIFAEAPKKAIEPGRTAKAGSENARRGLCPPSFPIPADFLGELCGCSLRTLRFKIFFAALADFSLRTSRLKAFELSARRAAGLRFFAMQELHNGLVQPRPHRLPFLRPRDVADVNLYATSRRTQIDRRLR